MKFLITNIRHNYIITKANISFLLKSLACFLLAKVPTTSPLPLYFSGNMFHLTGMVTFPIIKAKNSPASLKYSQWIFLIVVNYEKIHFSFHDKLDVYVLVMIASCGKKKSAAQVMMKKNKPKKKFLFLHLLHDSSCFFFIFFYLNPSSMSLPQLYTF